ncbi:MAG: hypothetical protein QXL50_01700 [Candidatus Pacearchaeota archaeon]
MIIMNYSKIKKLKKEYLKFVKKYKLPSFDELNKEFEIEEIKFGKSFLLRDIRRRMIGKILFYLSTFEDLLIPSKPSSMFIANKLKNEDKEKINKILSSMRMLLIQEIFINELEYNEKNDAEMIKKIYTSWKEIKKEIKKIGKTILKENKKSKLSYLG